MYGGGVERCFGAQDRVATKEQDTGRRRRVLATRCWNTQKPQKNAENAETEEEREVRRPRWASGGRPDRGHTVLEKQFVW